MAQASQERSHHVDGVTTACAIRVTSNYGSPVDLVWLAFDGEPKRYATLEAGEAHAQTTYTTHLWRLDDAASGKVLGRYVGGSAHLELTPGGAVAVLPWSAAQPQRARYASIGFRQRGAVLGIPIMAFDCVESRAVAWAAFTLGRMMSGCPSDVLGRLVDTGAELALIGRGQLTCDIPPHAFMRKSAADGGRDIDGTTRGLGGTLAIPTTSVGEENVTMEGDGRYPMESILIHEFGHTVMNLGLTEGQRARVRQLYEDAKGRRLYSADIYMMANEDEYWAEGCQSWFDATIRTDVNDGVNTREKLKAHDPGLAAALKEAFGDGDWRYPDDSPAAFRHRQPSTRSKEAATAAACASPSTSSVVVSGTGFSSSSSAPSRAPQQPKRWPPGYSAATFRDMEASNGYVEATAAAAAAVQTEAPQLEPMDRARLVADNSAVSAMLPPMLAPCITTAGTRACAIGVVTFMRDVYTAVNRESLRSMIR